MTDLDSGDGASVDMQDQDSSAHVLPAKLTIAGVVDLCTELKTLLEKGGAQKLDGSNVTHIDTAGLQALIGFTNTLLADGGALHWEGSNDTIVDVATSLDLCQFLSLEREHHVEETELDDDLCPVF